MRMSALFLTSLYRFKKKTEKNLTMWNKVTGQRFLMPTFLLKLTGRRTAEFLKSFSR